MNPEETKQLHELLEGRLSAEQTRALLARMQGREDFREALESAAKSRPTVALAEEEGPRYRQYSYAEVAAARKARAPVRARWTVFCILMVVILTVGGVVMHTDRRPRELSVEALCQTALAAGVPWISGPTGRRTATPRVFELVLPPGSREVTVRVRRDGETVYERRFTAEDPGCFFTPVSGRAGEASFEGVEALIPFPAAEDLELSETVEHDLLARVGQGPWSTPVSFHVQRP